MKTKGLMAAKRVIPFRWLFSLYVFITVLQIFPWATVQGKALSVDASKFHINPLECYDRTLSCKGEVDQGFCVTNSQYMIDRCPWSCHFCRRAEGDTTKCQDLSVGCSAWVSREECKTRPEFMAQNCKRSCKLCGPESEFTDIETGCHRWAKSGGCQKYPELVQKCPYSCQKYAGLVPSTPPELSDGLKNTSSLEVQNSSQVSAPAVPLVTIRTNPDLQRLPEELQKDLEKDWWREKLFSLTKKQNEYVTHLEPPPPSLPVLSGVKNESQGGNETQGRNDSVVIVGPDGRDGTQQNANQTQEPPQPLAPRTYDSLVPQLVVGTPTWSSETGNEKHSFTTTEGQMTSANQAGIWTEEQEEDQDLDENGEEKGRVPPRLRDQRKRLEQVKNNGSFPYSGSGANEEEKERRLVAQDIGKNKGEEMKKFAWRLNFSGSGDDSRNLKTYRVFHVPGEVQERYFEKWDRFISGSGKGEGVRKTGTKADLFKSKQITASRKLSDHSYFSAIGEDENEALSEIDLSSSGGTQE